jgi:phosphoribosylanthranilate isomerase
MLRVKICGITNIEDALAAIACGADALGFIFYPESPRSVTPEVARAIISTLPPFISTVGVFVDKDIETLKTIVSETGLDVVQLHGSEPPEYCNLDKKTIKAIRVKDISDLDLLNQYKAASAFLLDTYSPDTIGGTGHVFNWEIALEAKRLGRIILAGGLTPDNIEEAVKLVQPYGIDVASGVEGSEKGKKDHHKLRLFIEKARKAALKYYV